MKDETLGIPQRGRLQGTRQIVSYNWLFYVVAPLFFLGVPFALHRSKAPRWMKNCGIAGSLLSLFWTAASLIVSWWVYDRSALYSWQWLHEIIPDAPQKWANIHCGLDESTLALRAIFPDAKSHVFDIFSPHEMTEPSIRRARKLTPPCVPAVSADYHDLPLENNALDVVFLFFAAHEIRERAGREALFGEVRRVVRPGGRVVLLEHARDAANFAAFGPGFLHFFSRAEWRTLARNAGFIIEQESAFTPFVRLLVLRAEKDAEGEA